MDHIRGVPSHQGLHVQEMQGKKSDLQGFNFLFIYFFHQDRPRESVSVVCVSVWGGFGSCSCAKAGLMFHTIARVWVRGSWRLNGLHSRGRRGAVRVWELDFLSRAPLCNWMQPSTWAMLQRKRLQYVHANTHLFSPYGLKCGTEERGADWTLWNVQEFSAVWSTCRNISVSGLTWFKSVYTCNPLRNTQNP